MSSKRMPLVGKSRNWRMDCCNFILRLASSEEAEGGAVGSLTWEGCIEASGLSRL